MKKINHTNFLNDRKKALNEKILPFRVGRICPKLANSILKKHFWAGAFVAAIVLGRKASGYLHPYVDVWIESCGKAGKVVVL